ncbi:MAG: zf-HC2 domain-containing protein [Candidatus Omnitrophota bacterium]
MPENIENLIRLIEQKTAGANPQSHPDEEMLACFLEGRLNAQEAKGLQEHLLICSACLDAFAANFAGIPQIELPAWLLERVESLIIPGEKLELMEIIIKVKEKILEIISTTGDVLVGQELVPAPVLRSRAINDFKDEVIILKDFKDIRVEAKIENKGQRVFNLIISVKQKETQKIIKDLRISIFRDELELESYLTGETSVIFEHVYLGKYKVEVSSPDAKLASILLDINM